MVPRCSWDPERENHFVEFTQVPSLKILVSPLWEQIVEKVAPRDPLGFQHVNLGNPLDFHMEPLIPWDFNR